MKPERQRIAIAEACGWKPGQCGWWESPQGMPHTTISLPNYLNDLNAMLEACETLDATQKRRFVEELIYLVFGVVNVPGVEFVFSRDLLFELINSSVSFHAQAFLRTLNLWREE